VGDRLGERISVKVLYKDYLVKVLVAFIGLRVEKGRRVDNIVII
jgi:hypothetical protein